MATLTPCCTPVIIPGPKGNRGSNGGNGTNGTDSFTVLTATFTMPAELASATASVSDSSWVPVGLKVFIRSLGTLFVTAVPTATSITLQNPKNTPNNVYMDNGAPGTIAGSGSLVVATGGQGPPGVLAGISGGDLEGNYPNPTLAITTTIGDLIVNNGAAVAPRNTRLAMGTSGKILHAQAAGNLPAWLSLDLNGGNTSLSGQLPLANGGTAYNAANIAALIKHLLAILTTKGDLVCYDNGGAIQRMPAGADGLVLAADSTQATGLRYVAQATGSSFYRVAASVSPLNPVPLAASLIGVTALPMTLDFAAGAGYGSKVITVKDELGTAGANPITLQSLVGETFEGAATYVININRGVVRLYWSGTDWKIA